MAHVDNLRGHYPAVRRGVFLDTGTCGPLSDQSVHAMQNALTLQLEEGRLAASYDQALEAVKQKVREQLAHLLRAPASSFVLTDGVAHGMNIVLWGLPLQAGDEVITTDLEHFSTVMPLTIQKQRRGVVIKVVDGALPADDLCTAIEQKITNRTRLIICSQVSVATGHRLPIERIAVVAHAHKVYLAVDGSHGAGAEATDLEEMDADFYVLSGKKWLCGPDGTGALYIRPTSLSELDPTYVGRPTLAHENALDFRGTYLGAPGGSRYEHSVGNFIQWTGFLESLHFLRVTVGWDYAYSRIRGLSGQLIDQLLDCDHVRVKTPIDTRVGMVHFQIRGVEAERFVQEAASRSITVGMSAPRNTVRVSTGFYNSDDDLGRLVNLVKASTS